MLTIALVISLEFQKSALQTQIYYIKFSWRINLIMQWRGSANKLMERSQTSIHYFLNVVIMKLALLFSFASIVLFGSVYGQKCRFSKDELDGKFDKFKSDCLDKGFDESTIDNCDSTVEKKMKKASSIKKCASLDKYLQKCGVACDSDEETSSTPGKIILNPEFFNMEY